MALKNKILIAFSFLFALVNYSCNKEERYGDKSIFRYNISDGLSSLDPAFARSLENVSTVNHLFNGLVQMNDKLELEAAIAKDWEILDSNRLYRFTLRNDVFFHSDTCFGKGQTRRVIANDFVYSFNRLVDEKLLSPGSWVLKPVLRNEKGELYIEAINDTTLEIKLTKAFPPFLGILSMKYCSVVPEEAITYYGPKFRQNPIGTGPFQFQYWKENTKLVLLKNPNYFELDSKGNQLPYLDALAINFVKDQEVAFLQFLKGDLDYLSGLKGSYKDELLNSNGQLRDKYSDKIQFLSSPFLNTEYLGFYLDTSTAENPLLIKNIRKAINYGFDRKKMLKYLRNNIGTAAEDGFIPLGLPPHQVVQNIGYSYHPEKVKDLLAEAGFPKGEGLPEVAISTTAQYLDICEYLQHQLGTFGIKIKIEVNPAATNNEQIANGKSSFFRKSWVADYPDAENYLSLFYSKNFAPDGPNYTHYKNSFYDSLYQSALIAKSNDERYVLYAKMDSCIIEDAPVVPLFYDQVVRFLPNNIVGIGVNPMNILDLKRTQKQ